MMPPITPAWAHLPSTWQKLMDLRNGNGSGFELQKELLTKLRTDLRFVAVATQALTWSWTLIRASLLLGLGSLAPVAGLPADLPGGPPLELPGQPFSVTVVCAPTCPVTFCPEAWFRDLSAYANGLDLTFMGSEPTPYGSAVAADLVSFYHRMLPMEALQQPVRVDWRSDPGRPHIGLVAEVGQDCCKDTDSVCTLLCRGVPLVVTAAEFSSLLEVLRAVSNAELRPEVIFAGENPFASLWKAPVPGTLAKPSTEAPVSAHPGSRVRLQGLQMHAELNGREAMVVEQLTESGRWRLRLSDGSEIAVRDANLAASRCDESPLPLEAPKSLSSAEVWNAVLHRSFGEHISQLLAMPTRSSSNAFWLGLRPGHAGSFAIDPLPGACGHMGQPFRIHQRAESPDRQICHSVGLGQSGAATMQWLRYD
eukprot:gnl/TRDRNA2_/TRDRNA2_121645_c1_seq1.p1 gnl/TRDRNA2_/TRDRNA2_121645_c1~~gnl/TRDRNA2_/TRDRNA2_121645_c1_seq1.p1  ORF type:complete len:482 (+),score=54.54 gnl/TRDRNA2_/TRDRNA2_121645_c1_seq1:178-1446(+)